jgi:alpha-1,3/alpha-1,6-mannosyltransferase
VQLAMIGGYDPKNVENIEHFEELNELCKSLNLSEKVVFLKSPSDEMKIKLLRRCQVLLYTPSNEHFGIVPLEAMYSRKPVIAVNSGGPTETVGELFNIFFYQ